MKLPDFEEDRSWNQLRSRMNADFLQFNSADWEDINVDDILKRLEFSGVEVGLNQIEFDSDGTFTFQGLKVLLYIKDQKYDPRNNADSTKGYRYHISNCSTIEEFKARKQFDRYVVSRRTDGIFAVNVLNTITRQYVVQNQELKMDVCKNCLMKLAYKGYSDHRRDSPIFKKFSLSDFFEQYKTSPITKLPRFDSATQPLNEYSPDFPQISYEYRQSKNWCCERCDLQLFNDAKFLHVHHKNGLKYDNNFLNLECLCIGCHAMEPGHLRMNFQADHRQFMLQWGNAWTKARQNM